MVKFQLEQLKQESQCKHDEITLWRIVNIFLDMQFNVNISITPDFGCCVEISRMEFRRGKLYPIGYAEGEGNTVPDALQDSAKNFYDAYCDEPEALLSEFVRMQKP